MHFKEDGIQTYLPEQNLGTLDPKEAAKVKELGDFETCRPGSVLGFQAYKFVEDCALLSDKKELLVGDSAIGDTNGDVILAPDWFPTGPPYEGPEAYSDRFRELMKRTFKAIVKESGATSLSASPEHGVYGSLQTRSEKL